jgi:hypothetical protein
MPRLRVQQGAPTAVVVLAVGLWLAGLALWLTFWGLVIYCLIKFAGSL